VLLSALLRYSWEGITTKATKSTKEEKGF